MAEKCANHPTVDATFVCAECGKHFCDACKIEHEGAVYCTGCRRIITIVLKKIKNWRIPSISAVLIGSTLAYSLFTGLAYINSKDAFDWLNYGTPTDTLIALAILFVVSSAFLGGLAAGLLTRSGEVISGAFTGLLLVAMHTAVDFAFEYYELPIANATTTFQKVVGISYYALLAVILGVIGGLLAVWIRGRAIRTGTKKALSSKSDDTP